VAFSSTFSYINDVVFINNEMQFYTYVYSIDTGELEIKDITESSTFVSCLDILLKKKDAGGKS
jgi:hypothetical protein